MKGWFAASGVLSGLILAWLLVSMDSCRRVYDIDPLGRLVEASASAPGPGASGAARPALPWAERFPKFPEVAAFVRPGDRLEETTTTGGYPLFSVTMSTLRVIRAGQGVLTARDGALEFWGAIVGLAAVPLFAWGVAAVWIAVARTRTRPPPPG